MTTIWNTKQTKEGQRACCVSLQKHPEYAKPSWHPVPGRRRATSWSLPL